MRANPQGSARDLVERCPPMRLTILLFVILLGIFTRVFGTEPIKTPPLPGKASSVSDDPNDWPMYNRDGSGTRYNFGEQALTKDNVANLVEKWRFPPVDSKEKIGIRTLARTKRFW